MLTEWSRRDGFMGRIILIVALVAGFASRVSGEDLARGRVLERVVCRGNADQTYALYLPPSYSPEHAWPILYCLDPRARGRVPVERFAKAAGAADWIVAGFDQLQAGASDQLTDAVAHGLGDLHGRQQELNRLWALLQGILVPLHRAAVFDLVWSFQATLSFLLGGRFSSKAIMPAQE